MEFWKKWLNIAVVFILTLSLLSPAVVRAENNTDATTTEEVVEDLLSESDENTKHVFSLINAIPSIKQLNETNHLLVQDARAAYEKLTDEQKQNVTNLQALVEKENALQALAEKVVAPQALNEVAEPEGYAYFSMEDFAERGDGAISPEQLGTIIAREKVPFYEGDTIADVTVRALETKGITPSYSGDTKGGFYLSSIQNFTHNGEFISSFGEFSAGSMSGWMVSLNDWFINMGASEFLVTEGDTITWQYTGDYGADIGSDWTDTSAKFTGLNLVGNVGQLSPAFDTAVKSYTLTVPGNTKTIQLKAEANKSSRIQYYVGNVEYKMLTDIPVNGGMVVTIKSTFEDTDSEKKDADEITVEVVFEKKAEIVPSDKTLLQTTIAKAEANKATAAVSADGKDIDPAEYWVTQTELDTFVEVIKTAQQLIADEAATQEVIDAKTLTLNQAIVAFNEAKKAGSKSAEQLTTQLGYNTASEYLVNILPTPTFGSEWVILALARGGYEVPAGYYETYYKNVVDHVQSVNGELHARKYTEYSRLVLALTAIGKDPRNVGGYNIVEKLYDFDKVVWQGVNGAYFGLIALDTWGFELPEDVTNTRQKLIDHILQKQLNDGGFALSGTKADPDMTGMAIQALAPYQSQETVAAATNRAVTILATIQKENGGYASWGTESAESAAQVITALASIGIDVTKDARFNKVLPNMMSFYSPTDGGFKHTHPETKANGMATEQVGYTLAAYKRLLNGQTKLYDMSDVKPSVEDGSNDGSTDSKDGDQEESIKPPTEEKEPLKEGLAYGETDFSITISSSEVPLSTTPIEIFEGDSVFDALKRATSLYGIPLSYRSTSYGIYIDGINGLYEFDRGPLSGWMYRVNGVFPAFSAALYTLQPGDRVEWLYTTDLGKDVGGYIEDIEKNPNEEKTDKDKQEEKEAKTTVVTVGEAAEHLKAELTAETIEQLLQDGVKKIVIQDIKGTKVELPTAALKLAKGEKAVVAVNQQADGKVIDVTLAITSKNGSTKALVTGKDYAKVTISAPTASATTVVLQSINGEYRAVPHKIVDGEIVLLVKSGGTFILSEEVVTFPDIAKLWNKDDIEFLASRHVIKGNSGTFAPNADITRAEFASMIARAIGLQATEAVQFADTKGKWYEADVQALYEAGITTGVSVNAFNPNEKMSREQAAAFMARVLAYVDFKVTATKSSSFKDADSINALYKQNIELLYSLDIMSGNQDGTFDAAGNLTRAQMAKILKRTLNTAGLM